jgi:pimeloyl-ACP methyl ester carboxylesterase
MSRRPVNVVRSSGGDDDAPAVLLVHGFGSDYHSTWGHSGWLSALDAAGRRWIAVDLPGHGASSRPRRASTYAPPRVLDALQAVAAANEPVDLVGYSLGGELALALAGSQPSTVRRLVVGGLGTRRPIDEHTAAAVRAARDGGPPLDDRTAEMWRAATALPGHDADALLAFLEGMAQAPDAAAFSGPTLVFAGGEDPLAAGAHTLAARLPDAQLLVLERRLHRTTLSATKLKRRAIDFLGGR